MIGVNQAPWNIWSWTIGACEIDSHGGNNIHEFNDQNQFQQAES